MVEPAVGARTDVRPLDVYRQMGHDRLWPEDLQLAVEVSVNAIRYSVPWYLSNPAPGTYDWEWIARPIDWLSRHGIVPIIDLLHYGAPAWLGDGVVNADFPARFAEYAAAFANRFAGEVRYYTPVNEPQTSAMFSGYLKRWPPYLEGVSGWAKVSLRLAEAMVLASRALRSTAKEVQLISAECFWGPSWEELLSAAKTPGEASSPRTSLLLSYFPASLAYGWVKPDSPLAAVLEKQGFEKETFIRFERDAQPPDVFGFNYYPYGWETGEEGCREKRDDLVRRCTVVYREFGLPVYITETSGGLTEEAKLLWVEALGQALQTLRHEGVDLRGINWWPLFETIQWDYRENGQSIVECIKPGLWNNGLFKIEPSPDGALRRVPTRVAAAWRDLMKKTLTTFSEVERQP